MRGKHLISTALTTVFFLGPLGIQVAEAQQEYVPKVTVQTLHQGELPGMDGKEMTVKHLAIPPGYIGGKHMHTGPVFVYVLEGVLTVETESGTASYGVGELYPEPLGAVMKGRNLSASDDLEILVFQVGEIGKPMMVKVE